MIENSLWRPVIEFSSASPPVYALDVVSEHTSIPTLDPNAQSKWIGLDYRCEGALLSVLEKISLVAAQVFETELAGELADATTVTLTLE